MSWLFDNTRLDEHDSCDESEAKSRVSYNIDDSSIIDQSISETHIDCESSADSNKSNSIFASSSHRESLIIPVKRKPLRVLDSDDDDDDQATNHISTQFEPTTEYEVPLPELPSEIYNAIEVLEASVSGSEEVTKQLQETGLSKDLSLTTKIGERMSKNFQLNSEDEHDSCDESEAKSRVSYNIDDSSIIDQSFSETDIDCESSADSNKSNTSNFASSSHRESLILPVKRKPLRVLDSDDDDDDQATNHISTQFEPTTEYEVPLPELPFETDNAIKVLEASVSGSEEVTRQLQETGLSKDLSLTTKIAKERISQNFQFNSEGILHSTAANMNDNEDPSVEILSDHDSDIIEVSSGEEALSPKKKTPLFKLRQAEGNIRAKPPLTPQEEETVSQCTDVETLEKEWIKLQNWMENINLDALPDQGQLIKNRVAIAEKRYKLAKGKLENMDESNTKVDDAPKGVFANVSWKDIEAGANAVLPKTFGKTAMSTYNAQKAMTMDRLQQLHGALQTCPKEDDQEEDPKGLKVPLMPHQKSALAWILFREKESPSGGILADDMGLGKTLTMLSLILKSLELERTSDSSDKENQPIGRHKKYEGGSLIVCPASLLNSWSAEIDRRLKRGLVSYTLYHGPKREMSAKKLAEYDIVITTYAIVSSEAEKMSALMKIKWRRIILDEAHTIRNYKTQTSLACCQLLAKSRWALTGTPMHNKELDMYALLKFLRCVPFDDLQVWKRWVSDKSSGGMERLHTVISSLMLRRTKTELMGKGVLNCMPENNLELIPVQLDPNEMRVYHKVMIFSQTLFAQFLHQRAEKNQDYVDQRSTEASNNAPNEEYFKMRQKLLKLNKVKDVSQHEILVLLLRLRQICCHPSLITAMLDGSRDDIGEGDDECEQLNLLEQLEKLNIQDEDEFQPEASLGAVAQGISQDNKITLKEASKGHLHPSDPVFASDRASSKIKAVLEVLKTKVLSQGDKAIIVSQWSSYLNLVAVHLKKYDINFDQLDGKVPVNKRMAIVDRLNNPKDEMRVLLLSLTAGGVGLNLTGANHLFLLDLHWNPQLEKQAQDRIYRVGQMKPVFVYKFMATDTIEERIKALQDKKLAMAEGLLTGTKQVTESKLSIQELRTIFGM